LRKIRVHHKFARNGREENVPESEDGDRRRHWNFREREREMAAM